MSVTPVKGRKNVYDVVVWVRGPGGGRQRRTKRVEGLRAAQKVQRDFLNDRDAGKRGGKPKTFAAYAATYLDGRQDEVSARTMLGYTETVQRYLVPAIGDMLLPDIDVDTVRTLYKALRARGLSSGTVSIVHRTLSMILQAAFEDEKINRNPCHKAKVAKDDTKRERGLAPAACKALLASLEGTAVHAPAKLAALTGLRRGEILALKWENIDFEAVELHVEAALEQVGGQVTRKSPKTQRSRRTVPLSPEALALLRRHKANQDELRLHWGVAWRDEDYVFPAERVTNELSGGRVWTPDAFQQAFRKAQIRNEEIRLAEFVAAGGAVEDFTPVIVGMHDFRHTAATTWLRGGQRMEVVSRWLGHANSVITSTTYSHVTVEEYHGGVEAVDELV